jgi:homocysteine S-methyltransferase
VVALVDRGLAVVAIGINCTAPRYIPQLVRAARRATRKPIVVYPNSGENYDVQQKRWTGQSAPQDFAGLSRSWREAGATLLGGCCRTRPQHIARIRAIQLNEPAPDR